MTFNELVSEVMSRLNLTSSTATTRVGAAINRKYRELTASVGLNVTRRVEVSENTTADTPFLIFSDIEKVLNVIDKRTGRNKVLTEVSVEEIQASAPVEGDSPSTYAIWKMDANEVTILLDQTPTGIYVLYANGYSENSTLSGSNVPAFPDSYHEVLVEGVLYDEYRKLEKPQLAMMAKQAHNELLSDLRMFIAKNGGMDVYQGRLSSSSGFASGGGGSDTGDVDIDLIRHATMTIDGVWTFDKDPSAPFVVTSGSAKVTNLDADLLDGEEGSAYHNAANLTGTIAAISGANVTTLNATNLSSGTVPHARKWSTTTTTSTGNQDNFSFSSSDEILCNNASLLTLRGLSAGAAGQRLMLISIGAGQVDISNQDANSTAANRIINGVTGTISLAAGVGRALLEYDATTARWRVIEHEQGAWITPTFAAGDYTGNASMTWTVASGDVTRCAYWLKGRTLHVSLTLATTTVGGTPSTALQRVIPNSLTAVGTAGGPFNYSDNGTAGVGAWQANSTTIALQKDMNAGANWTASTDATSIRATMAFEVQ